MRAYTAVAIVFLLLFSIRTTASAEIKFSSARFEVGVSSIYDDNILRYSDKYISRFNNGEDRGRFHVNTRDDLILVNAFRASATARVIGTLSTTVTVDFRQRTYATNNIKNWSYYSFSLKQDLSKNLAALVEYSYIPTFYIRHFRDDDWTILYSFNDPVVFQPFGFQKDETGGWLQYTLFPGTRIRGALSYARYFYNEHFTEYDCDNTTLGLAVYQTVLKNVKLNAEFDAVFSRGDGTPDMSPSYDQNIYSLGVEYQLPMFLGFANQVEIGGEYARSCYTSTHFAETDPNHAGRDDRSYRFSLGYRVDLLKSLGLALSYAWHRRDVKTSAQQNAAYLSEEKDYRQYQIGIDIRYTMNLFP